MSSSIQPTLETSTPPDTDLWREAPLGSVAVVIVTYNGEEVIDGCLKSLNASEYPIHLLLVDNASTDSTLERARSYPQVEIIATGENAGFGRGNNVGIRRALELGADYLFLFNQDAHCEPDTIAKLLQVATKHPEFGIVSPVHLAPATGQFDPSFLSNYLISSAEFLSDSYHQRLKEVYEVKSANAAAWLLSRKCIETVGGFDPLFFMYGEDDDLAARVRHHGFKIAVAAEARIVHLRHKSKSKGKKTFRAEVRGCADKRFRGMLLKLKKDKHLNQSYWKMVVGSAAYFFQELLLDHRMAVLLGELEALWRLTKMLPQIRAHRAKCREIGKHWL